MTSPETPRVRGYWASLWLHRRGVFWSWDIWTSAALAAAAGIGVRDRTIDQALGNLLLAQTAALAAVLGIVIAGLAIVASQLSRPFLSALSRSTGGIEADFFPFWHLTAVLVVGVAFAGGGYLVLPQATCVQARVVLVATTFFGTYGLFATVNLVALIVGQGVNRALQILQESES